jgi:hypothetical protein
MAIRRKDRPKYLAKLEEVRGMTYFGYGDKVQAAAKLAGMDLCHNQIYRVVSGQLKNWEMLNIIQQVLLEEI